MNQNIWSRVLVGAAATCLVVMVATVIYCAGWFGGVGAGYAARVSERGAGRVIVVKDGVEIPDRPPTAEERLMASQLGADSAFNVDDKRVVARIDGEWFRYERESGRLVLKLDENKQD